MTVEDDDDDDTALGVSKPLAALILAAISPDRKEGVVLEGAPKGEAEVEAAAKGDALEEKLANVAWGFFVGVAVVRAGVGTAGTSVEGGSASFMSTEGSERAADGGGSSMSCVAVGD